MTPLLAQVIAAVRAVGRDEVMPRYLKVAHARKDDGSLFTEADLAAQNALIERLTAIAPYPVLGEEMDDQVHKRLWHEGADGLWCVDPIDGTTNFVSGMPFFAMSIALMKQGRPVL
ncbi:MAG: inositol monophosphatase family protein, partial [Hydrogenophilaceae bacterium]